MRYPVEHKQETHERIVAAAARWFRGHGSDGTAIGDLMRDLRLTHGGFYRHFKRKEDLFAEAFAHGLRELGDRVAEAAEQAPPGAKTKALIDAYLTTQHCDDAADGCPVAALSSEIARRPDRARGKFQRALKEHVTRMAVYLPGTSAEERFGKAMLLFSGMAGTLSVIRIVDDPHRRLEMLEQARGFYLHAVGG